jgi:hypothetical protein
MASKQPDHPGYPSVPKAPVMPPAERRPAVSEPKPIAVPPYRHPAERSPGEA